MLLTSIHIACRAYMIQYNHAKLLRQCVLFWPRNRFSRERVTVPADKTLVDPSIGGL